MDAFTRSKVRFSTSLDSKGRITVPSRIRDKLNLNRGDSVLISVDSSDLIRREFSSEKDALEFLEGLEGVDSFSYQDNLLEVVING